MKAIIDGKRYATDKAECIAEWHSTYDSQDFAWYSEALYHTANGAWFLACEGNASSPYGRCVAQNEYGPGEQLRPLTEDEVVEWLERHEYPGVLEDWFQDRLVDA